MVFATRYILTELFVHWVSVGDPNGEPFGTLVVAHKLQWPPLPDQSLAWDGSHILGAEHSHSGEQWLHVGLMKAMNPDVEALQLEHSPDIDESLAVRDWKMDQKAVKFRKKDFQWFVPLSIVRMKLVIQFGQLQPRDGK